MSGIEKLVIKNFKDLNFDYKMDTQLAENYLENKTDRFDSINCEKLDIYIDVNNQSLKKLSEEIDKNAELFAQLEYLNRKVSKKEVLEYDIEIIKYHLENFQHINSNVKRELYNSTIYMEGKPLCHLALAIILWTKHIPVTITTSPGTIAICTLFAELCHKAGLKHAIELARSDLEADSQELYKHVSASKGFAMGVVTEAADVDSAVDILLSAPAHPLYPWKLRRVVVQENVYQQFKAAMEFKAGRLTTISDRNKYAPHCVVYSDGDIMDKDLTGFDKILVFDPSVDHSKNYLPIISIEAYRTTKELLALTQKFNPVYISLWCSDLSTANQIAFSCQTQAVSINSFGDFIRSQHTINMINNVVFKTVTNHILLNKKWSNWKNLSVEERRLALINALNLATEHLDKTELDKAMSVVNCNLNSVEIKDCKMILCLNQCQGIIVIDDSDYSLESILACLLGGNGILLKIKSPVYKLFDTLDLPIKVVTNDFCDDKAESIKSDFISSNPLNSFKYIWSSYGESFAN